MSYCFQKKKIIVSIKKNRFTLKESRILTNLKPFYEWNSKMIQHNDKQIIILHKAKKVIALSCSLWQKTLIEFISNKKKNSWHINHNS